MADALLRSRNQDGPGAGARVAPPAIDRRRPDLRTYGTVEAERRRGRGATANPDGRYEPVQRERIDDGSATAQSASQSRPTSHTGEASTTNSWSCAGWASRA